MFTDVVAMLRLIVARHGDHFGVNWAQEGSMESHALVTSLGGVRSSLTRLPRLLYFAAVQVARSQSGAPRVRQRSSPAGALHGGVTQRLLACHQDRVSHSHHHGIATVAARAALTAHRAQGKLVWCLLRGGSPGT